MKICPNCNHPLTSNANAKWRVRVRLYEVDNPEPLADTDPDLPAAAPGSTLLTTLPAMAEHVAKLAYSFHGVAHGEIKGLEPETLRHKLKSLRPTLSRRKGNATWRLPYWTGPSPVNLSASYTRHFTARVDVERVTTKGEGIRTGETAETSREKTGEKSAA